MIFIILIGLVYSILDIVGVFYLVKIIQCLIVFIILTLISRTYNLNKENFIRIFRLLIIFILIIIIINFHQLF